uniref:Uncharacterized protein n=1 Tax=Megaselia scalaris TaxID=36166 RepID=T1GJ71_MEGSC
MISSPLANTIETTIAAVPLNSDHASAAASRVVSRGTTSITLSVRFTNNLGHRIDTGLLETSQIAFLLEESRHPLLVFSGDMEDWPLFESSILKSNEAFQYSDLENNMRLVECLKGKAKEALESLLIHLH